MRRLFVATGIGVSSLTASAQLPPEEWFSSCDGPSATCISPHIEHLADYTSHLGGRSPNEPNCGSMTAMLESPRPAFAAVRRDAELLVAFHEPSLIPIADDAREVLRRWSIASRSHMPVTEAERLRMQYASPERSGQVLATTCELQGPIDDDELNRRYDWTVTDDVDAVELTAVPKDRLERLFYDRFTVRLDAATWRPTAVEFVAADRSETAVVGLHPWVDDEAGVVQVVAFRPMDQTPIRTADASPDEPRLLRSEPAVLELPPAPTPCEPETARPPVEASKPTAPAEPAALRTLLEKYDRNYAGLDRLQLELRRWQYDATFEIETKSRVSLFLEEHRLGWLESHPPEAAWAKAPARDGFEPKPGQTYGWRWEADRFTTYDPTSNAVVQMTALPMNPASSSDRGRLWGGFTVFGDPSRILPVWADRSAVSLQTKFELALVPHPDPTVARVVATPRTDDAASSFQRLDILFDRETGCPQATRTFDPSGNRETVLTAVDMSLDGPWLPVKALKPSS